MSDLRSSIYEIYSLEQASGGDSPIHRLHPAVKIAATLFYIILVVSFGRYELSALAPFVLYPVAASSFAGVPCSMIFKRTLTALPFCLFAGVSNVFFDVSAAFTVGAVTVSAGWLSLAAIVFRTLLCVSAVLVLVAVTPFTELTRELRAMRLPSVFISLFEMTYRYVGALAAEAFSMYTAYSLRGKNKRGIEMKDMGSFAGQLLIRSFDRAERVYQAMRCRGYPAAAGGMQARPLSVRDLLFLVAVCASSLFFRFVNVPVLIGRLF